QQRLVLHEALQQRLGRAAIGLRLGIARGGRVLLRRCDNLWLGDRLRIGRGCDRRYRRRLVTGGLVITRRGIIRGLGVRLDGYLGAGISLLGGRFLRFEVADQRSVSATLFGWHRQDVRQLTVPAQLALQRRQLCVLQAQQALQGFQLALQVRQAVGNLGLFPFGGIQLLLGAVQCVPQAAVFAIGGRIRVVFICLVDTRDQ